MKPRGGWSAEVGELWGAHYLLGNWMACRRRSFFQRRCDQSLDVTDSREGDVGAVVGRPRFLARARPARAGGVETFRIERGAASYRNECAWCY
jgi:hypothetical protein